MKKDIRHLIEPMDFTVEELDDIFNLAHQIMAHPEKFSHICDGKILATLFMSQVQGLD